MKIFGFRFVEILGKKYDSKMDICMENWIFFKIGPGSFYLFLTI